MGIIVDPKKAKESPCKCIITGNPDKPEDRLCFSKGIVGALSDEQELEYCTDILAIETSKKFSDRINRFRTLGDILDICLESEEKDFLGCIESQARKLKSEK